VDHPRSWAEDVPEQKNIHRACSARQGAIGWRNVVQKGTNQITKVKTGFFQGQEEKYFQRTRGNNIRRVPGVKRRPAISKKEEIRTQLLNRVKKLTVLTCCREKISSKRAPNKRGDKKYKGPDLITLIKSNKPKTKGAKMASNYHERSYLT